MSYKRWAGCGLLWAAACGLEGTLAHAQTTPNVPRTLPVSVGAASQCEPVGAPPLLVSAYNQGPSYPTGNPFLRRTSDNGPVGQTGRIALGRTSGPASSGDVILAQYTEAPRTPAQPSGQPPLSPEAQASVLPGALASPTEHPLMPAVRWAREGLKQIEAIDDYSATLVKREQLNGEVGEHEYMFVKVRHRPFSVYINFLAPARSKGQEAIYVEGRNDGKLLAHPTGIRQRLVGTVSLHPTSMLAMAGNRYPVTEIGILNLTRRLIEVGENDMRYGECEVKFLENAKINGRNCTCIQVMHPVKRPEFLFYLARIYVDTELNLPIRYEAYDWPESPGAAPKLQEEYTYLNLKLNNGFTDLDFDVANPAYNFK